jgi:tellurite resistance protein
MKFTIDDQLVRALLGGERLSVAEVRAIAQLAYLTGEIDLDEDADERATLAEIASALWHASDREPQPIEPVARIPIDDEERRQTIAALARELSTRGAREVAYVTAYLMATSDLQIARTEGRFLDDLQRALGLTDERAADLAAMAAEWVTPGLAEEEERAELQPRHVE